MIKRKFINPGAYSIFANQLQNDGFKQDEVASIMDIEPASYLSAIKRGDANPSYNLVLKTDVALKTFFHTNEKYKRHLRKITEVFETDTLIDWIEFHEDLEYFCYMMHLEKQCQTYIAARVP